jgi:hypothetical protein
VKVDDAMPHPEPARATKTGRGPRTQVIVIRNIQHARGFRWMDEVERGLPLRMIDGAFSIHRSSV